jgi:thioesterase domain-containing protein
MEGQRWSGAVRTIEEYPVGSAHFDVIDAGEAEGLPNRRIHEPCDG